MNSTIKKLFGYSAVVLGSAMVAGVTTYALMEKHFNTVAMSSAQTDSFAMPAALFDSKPVQPVDLTDAAENSVHAVVHIKSTQLGRTQTVQQMPDLFDFFFGDGMGRQQQVRTQPRVGFGSGVIISKDGYIVTNNHVIDGADEIDVSTRPFVEVNRIELTPVPVSPLTPSAKTPVFSPLICQYPF